MQKPSFYIVMTWIFPGVCAWLVIKSFICHPLLYIMLKICPYQEPGSLHPQKYIILQKQQYLTHGGESEKKAAQEYRKREKEGTLPQMIDPEHKIGRFLGDEYCKMRFKFNH